MVIGVLQVELYIGGASSLKDKRSVVKSIKDRLGGDPTVAVAEVDRHDTHRIAVLGVTTVSNSADRAREVLNRVLRDLGRHREAVVSDHRIEVISGR